MILLFLNHFPLNEPDLNHVIKWAVITGARNAFDIQSCITNRVRFCIQSLNGILNKIDNYILIILFE